MKTCIFCNIVNKTHKSFQIWEDDKHLAFLSIYPNTPGVTVVIPKTHYSSYAFDLPERLLCDLILASQKVAKLIDSKLFDVGRTALVFEGFGVDHVHAKLIPLHGTAHLKKWSPIKSNINTYFEKYEGYISSHDSALADEKELECIAKTLLHNNGDT